MKRLYKVLFILGALSVPICASGQEPFHIWSILPRLVPLEYAAEEGLTCIPDPGQDVMVIFRGELHRHVAVESLSLDLWNGGYAITLLEQSVVKLPNCARRTDVFHVWLVTDRNGFKTQQPMFIYVETPEIEPLTGISFTRTR